METRTSNSALRAATIPVAALAALLAMLLLLSIGPAGASGAAPTADAGGPYFIAEGDDLALDASASTDPESDPLSYGWDLDNDGDFNDAAGVTPTVPWSVLGDTGIGDNGVYTVGLKVGDGSNSVSTLATLTITNTQPVVTVSGPAIAGAGLPFRLSVDVADPGDDSIASWIINWGDGGIDSGTGQPGDHLHTYAVAGLSHGITVQVSDDDGTWLTAEVVVPYYDTTETVSRFEASTGAKVVNLGSTAGALTTPHSSTLGADGLIYVTGLGSDSVVRFDPTSNNYLDTFVAPGSGGLSNPKGLAFGPDGHLYVADSGNGRVLRFNGNSGAFIDIFAGVGTLNGPGAILFTPDSTLLVADQTDDNIERYDAISGAYSGVFSTTAVSDEPSGLTIAPNGNVLVAMFGGGTVKEFTADTGAFVGNFISSGLTNPHSLSFGPDGELWVSDYFTEQILRFDGATGAALGPRIGEPSPVGPRGFSFIPDHTIAVTAPLTVNSTGDAGDAATGNGLCDTGNTNSQGATECTLRAALEEASAPGGADYISFDIPTSEPGYSISPIAFTLTPATAYPVIINPVVIDGSTQPGYTGDPVVQLDGSSAPAATAGLLIQSDDSTIEAMVVHSFADEGIEIAGSVGTGDNNTIRNNWIGIDRNGNVAANGDIGVLLTTSAADNLVIDNVIAGNANAGLVIRGGGSNDNVVVGNSIGVAPDGVTAVPNGSHGIEILDLAADNSVGGPAAAQSNSIVNNAADGIAILAGTGIGNNIVGNTIHSNGGLGIDLGNDGVTLNNNLDVWTNYPVITTAEAASGTIDLSGTLDAPAGTYRVEVFKNQTGADPSGSGEGEQFVSSLTHLHAGAGPEPWSTTIPGTIGDVVSMTASLDLGGGAYRSTSEFSLATTVVGAPNTLPTADAGGPYTTGEGDSLVLDGSGSTDLEPLTYEWDLNNDGTFGDVTGVNPTVTWVTLATFGINDEGSYTVGLRVDDSTTGTDIDTATLTVTNASPAISVGGPGSILLTQPYTVALSATDPGDDTITSWTINWGDGTIDNLAGNPSSASHTYSRKGSFNITAAVTDEDGTFITSRLQVADSVGGTAEEYDGNTGDQIREFPPNAALVGPTKVVIGPDGYTYVSGLTSDSVVRYDTATGSFVDSFVTAGSGGLDGAGGLAWMGDGDLLVTSFNTDSVKRYDGISGAFVEDFVTSGLGGLDGPIDLALRSDGDVFVSGRLSHSIVQYDAITGALGNVISPATAGFGTGLAFGPDGNLYVGSSNGTLSSVDKYDGATGTALGAFLNLANAPFGLVWGPDGNLWVSSDTADLVNVYSSAGILLRTHSSAVDGLLDALLIDFSPDHQVVVEAFGVNSTGDGTDLTPGDGRCTTGGTNALGQPECTLRAAIEEANFAADPDLITFTIPVGDLGYDAVGEYWKIAPGSQLPSIDQTTILDGTTQPGWGSTPVIEIDGTSAGVASDGLTVLSSNTSIRGFAINRFGGEGIAVTGAAASTVIAGNHIGLDPAGLVNRGNLSWGIELQLGSGPTTIGGTTSLDRNVISGNDDTGVIVYGSNDNIIIGNYIGTDVSGLSPIGNSADGINLANGSTGNEIGQPGSGNVISGNSNDGIEVVGATGSNTIYDNLIGLGVDGTTIVANARHGIVLFDGANNTQIGGTGFGEGNIISGNGFEGIRIDGNANPATTANVIAGNIIGLDQTATFGVGNGTHGVRIFGAAHSNALGGSDSAARNIISANGGDGVWFSGSGSDNNVVDGNYIGTNGAGDTARGNGASGVDIDLGAASTVVGTAGIGNLLSGNGDAGIFVGDVSPGTIIHGNLIGTNAAGTGPLPNLWLGVALWGGPTATQIGGLGGGEANTIAYNAGDGVWLKQDAGIANPIRGNSIHSNDGLGINLEGLVDLPSGITPNDGFDLDGGPNLLQNWPVLTSAVATTGNTTITGSLNSGAATNHSIDFFSTPAGDVSGNGEGAVYLGSSSVFTVFNGFGAISTVLPISVASGHVIAATVTDPNGNTSEFGNAVVVTSATAIVNSTSDAGDVVAGDDLCNTGGLNSEGEVECTLRAAIEEANASSLVIGIDFDIPTTDPGHAAGVWTISPASALPTIATLTNLDASSQPGYFGVPIIEIDGALTTGSTDGLTINNTADNSTIQAVAIINFPDNGLVIFGFADGVKVLSSYIGVTSGGLAAGNGDDGVDTNGAALVEIDGNVISDNVGSGIQLEGDAVTITANKIGVGIDGSTPMGNGGEGIFVTAGATASVIGGTSSSDANIFAYNGRDGIYLNSVSPPDGITILGNTIHDNAGLGIDLGTDGVTGNDPGDGDLGANGLLNFPEITSVSRVGSDLVVNLSLDAPAGNYRVELFGNRAADPSGNGEGDTLLGSAAITHLGAGPQPLTITMTSGATILSATATLDLGLGSFGSTSEFSPAVPSPDLVIVNSAGDGQDLTAGNGACDTGGVNSQGNTECTLRSAIEEANASAVVDTIWFGIPTSDAGYDPSGWWTIAPGSDLPATTAAVSIDATTQPGWTTQPIVEIDGTAAGPAGRGFFLDAGGEELRGLAIGNFSGSAIWAQVGGSTIAGNTIGLAADGATNWGNGTEGVSIFNTSSAVTVGGPNSADINIIVGSGTAGIGLTNADNTVIIGNFIGVLRDGVSPLANNGGVYAQTSAGVLIGGSAPGMGNVISGNTFQGIQLDNGSDTATIRGNLIGVGADGSATVPNGATGIHLTSTATDHAIGGSAAGEGNTIANNGGDGVLVESTGVAPSILANSISQNADMGIDYGDDGITDNDTPDIDTIPNYPVLGNAIASGGQISIGYTLNAAAGTYRLEFFSNPSGVDPSGYGEGELFLTSTSVVLGGLNFGSGTVLMPGFAGDIISATATRENGGANFGSTSEFSASVTAVTQTLASVIDQTQRRSDAGAVGGLDPRSAIPGAAGSALAFDGNDDRLLGPGLDITSNALNMSGWVNLSAMGTDPRIIAKAASSGPAIYELLVDSTTTEAVARVRVGGVGYEARGGSVSTASWHQVSATWNGADLALYVDGAQVDTVAAAGILDTEPAELVRVGNNNLNNRGIDGGLDHVQVKHREVSGDETAAHFANINDSSSFIQLGDEQTTTPNAWTIDTTQSHSGSYALEAPETSGADAAAWAVAIGVDEPGIVFESWWYFTSDTTIDASAGTRTGLVPTNQFEAALTSPSGWELRQRKGTVESSDAAASGTPTTGTWMEVAVWTRPNGDSRILIDGVEVTPWTVQGTALISGSVGFRAGALQAIDDWYIDDARARKLVFPEPITNLGPLDRN